jgi:hypothetical protein
MTDEELIEVCKGNTVDELKTAVRVVRGIAFRAGYGKNPELCMAANKVLWNLNIIIESNAERQSRREATYSERSGSTIGGQDEGR